MGIDALMTIDGQYSVFWKTLAMLLFSGYIIAGPMIVLYYRYARTVLPELSKIDLMALVKMIVDTYTIVEKTNGHLISVCKKDGEVVNTPPSITHYIETKDRLNELELSITRGNELLEAIDDRLSKMAARSADTNKTVGILAGIMEEMSKRPCMLQGGMCDTDAELDSSLDEYSNQSAVKKLLGVKKTLEQARG